MTFVDAAIGAVAGRSDVRGRALERSQVKTRLRRLGMGVLVLQLALMIAWSAFEVSRFAELKDFAGFYRAWYLIGHGVLNPGPGWWKAQAIFIMWPLGLVAALFPHPVALLIIQDVAVFGAELVAYLWIVDIVSERRSLPLGQCSLLALASLVLNPWVYWSISWDYHSEAVGVLFAILAARAFYSRRPSAWLWSLVTLTCGMVPATYLLGIGLGLVLSKGRRRTGLLLGVIAFAWFLLMLKLGAGAGLLPEGHTGGGQESPIGAVVNHLGRTIRQLPGDSPDMLANLAPTGFIGVLTAPVIGIAIVVFGSSVTAEGVTLIVPGFQDFALYVFAPVGTALALGYISRRFGSRVLRVVMLLILVSVVGWGAVWLPQLKSHWIRVSAQDAAALRTAQKLIPANADLIISDGVSGLFAARDHYSLISRFTTSRPAVKGNDVWFLIAPYSGVETKGVADSASVIQFVAEHLRARLVFERDGIWLFEWHPKPGVKRVLLPKTSREISAALFDTNGIRDTRGRPQDWSMRGSGKPTEIVYGDYWLKRVGDYRGTVAVQSDGPFVVGIRNASTGAVLSQVQLPRTHGLERVSVPASITPNDPKASAFPYKGFGPFRVNPVPGQPGNYLEMTVSSLGSAKISVRSIAVTRAPRT